MLNTKLLSFFFFLTGVNFVFLFQMRHILLNNFDKYNVYIKIYISGSMILCKVGGSGFKSSPGYPAF